MSEPLVIYTIYEKPEDRPDVWVVRIWKGTENNGILGLAWSLEEARGMIPAGLVKIPRSNGDVPCIVESWI